jgi:hypothetical protein
MPAFVIGSWVFGPTLLRFLSEPSPKAMASDPFLQS